MSDAMPSLETEPASEAPKVGIADDGSLSLRRQDLAGLARAAGTDDLNLTSYVFGELVNGLRVSESETKTNAALSRMYGIAPQGPIETMLAEQMLLTHDLALTYMRRSATAETYMAGELSVKLATKLGALFAKQAEAMNKLRRGPSQQVVRVEHVTVNEGGQAVVGAVSKT